MTHHFNRVELPPIEVYLPRPAQQAWALEPDSEVFRIEKYMEEAEDEVELAGTI